MPAKQNIYGWDGANWVAILVNAAGKLIIDPSEILEDVPTDGEVAKAPTSNWAYDIEQTIAGISGLPASIAGGLLESAADVAQSVMSTVYVKKKETILGRAGVYRIAFSIRIAATPGTVWGQICRNDIAVGTERSNSTSAYVGFSEDIAGWSRGDLCQVWLKGTAGDTLYVNNFRIYTGNPLVATAIIA